MQKSLQFIVVLFLTFISSSAYAKIFRVGYPGTPLTGVDYTDFQTAHNAAAAGDTVQIYQQYGSVSGGNVTKKLTIIGFGYMLDKNPGLQALNNADQNAINFYFQPGSAGSIAQGLHITGQIIANDIIINRCRIAGYFYLTTNQAPLSGISIRDCYIDGFIIDNGSNPISNLRIVNNVCKGQISLPNSSGFFANNITFSHVSLKSFLIKNNIFLYSQVQADGNIFENNLFSSTNSSIIGTDNKFQVDMSTVFSNWNNGNIQADNQLTLKAGSPAIGAGKKNDGSVTDAGIFGGEAGYIYKLSGIPAVPAIYKLTAPSRSANTNPYTISVGVRSNN